MKREVKFSQLPCTIENSKTCSFDFSAYCNINETYSEVNAFNPLKASGANLRISLLLRSLKRKKII